MNRQELLTLDTGQPIWDHFFTVAPLVVVGTREGTGVDLAPKHMVTPLGHDNYFGFVCTPRHATYHNVAENGTFAVSFPKPNQVVLSSLAASPRCGTEGDKPILDRLPVRYLDGSPDPFLADSYLYLACRHDRTIDGFGQHSLICGEITGAWVDEAYHREHERDAQGQLFRHPLLAFLAYGRFAEIHDTRAFPLPADFKT